MESSKAFFVAHLKFVVHVRERKASKNGKKKTSFAQANDFVNFEKNDGAFQFGVYFGETTRVNCE